MAVPFILHLSAFCWTFLIAGVDSQIVEEDPQPNRETWKGQSVGMLKNGRGDSEGIIMLPFPK